MILPKYNDIIKHERFTDVAIQISKPVYVTDSGKLKIRGNWLNTGNPSFVIGSMRNMVGKATLIILPDEIEKWSICLDPDATHLKGTKWGSLK
jgi:hypothetical protein